MKKNGLGNLCSSITALCIVIELKIFLMSDKMQYNFYKSDIIPLNNWYSNKFKGIVKKLFHELQGQTFFISDSTN